MPTGCSLGLACFSDIEKVARSAAASASSFLRLQILFQNKMDYKKTHKTPNKKSLSLFQECQLRAKIFKSLAQLLKYYIKNGIVSKIEQW